MNSEEEEEMEDSGGDAADVGPEADPEAEAGEVPVSQRARKTSTITNLS